MVKRRREANSDGANTEAADYRTVFVDTSLDTHLAVVVSKSDTVSDCKRKIVLEHRRCFPEIEEIHIRSLKVKRRAIFYHLSDLMLVWRVFQGANTNWFLSADASATPKLNQDSLQLGSSDGVKMVVNNIDDNSCRGLLSVVNTLQTLPMPLPDGVSEKNLASEIIPVFEVDKSLEKTAEIKSNDYSEENCVGTESRAKKKRKISHTEDVCHNPSLEDMSALSRLSGNDTSLPETVGSGISTVDSVKEVTGSIILYQQQEKLNTSTAANEVSDVRNDECDIENGVAVEDKSALPETVGSGNSTVDAVKEATEDIIIYQQEGKPDTSNATDGASGSRNDPCDVENGVGLEGKSALDTAEESNLGSIVNSETILDSDVRKEDTLLESTVPEDLMASKLEYEHGQDVTIEYSEDVSVRVPDSSGAIGGFSSDGSKKKRKKKAHKPGKKIQDNTDMEHSTKDDSMKPCAETREVDKKEEEKGLTLNGDREIITPSNSKASDRADLDLMPNKASFSSDVCHANAIVEPDSSVAMGDVTSDGIKKKKNKAQKTAKHIQDTTDMEQITRDGSIKPCTETHKADKKDEEKSSSRNCDREIVTPLNSKDSDHADPDLLPKELSFSSQLCHANAIVVPDSSLPMGDVSSDGSKKKKKKAQKTANFQDTTCMEQITKDDSIKPCTETHKAEKNEEEKGLSLYCDREIVTPLNSKASDHADPDLVTEEARPSPQVCHGNAIVEPDCSEAVGDVYSNRNKRMKKKAKKAAKKLQNTTDMEQTPKDDSTKACTETRKDNEEEEKGLSLNLDHETVMPSNSRASEHADQDLMPESSFSTQFDANAIVQPEISSGGRKKKRKRKEKKSAKTDIEKAAIEQTDNGGIVSSELLCPPTDPIPEETHKEESILCHKEMDVDMALLDSSTQNASEEVRGADKNEAEFLVLTQTEQALNDVDTGNKKEEEKIEKLSAVVKDNSIVEFTEVEKDIKNSEGKIEKAKRKRKRKHTGSDVQENLPSKDQKVVGIEALTTEENLNSFVNSEQEEHEASLQVLSNKSEEKLEEMHRDPVITDDPAKTSENGDVGVNFKQYFVPGQNEDKSDSGDKTAAKSNEEMKTSENIKGSGLPSVDVSTDLQNSTKTIKNKEREKKARVTKDSGSRQGNSEQNPAMDEVIFNSSKSSSRASKNRVHPSLNKSNSKKTQTLPEKKENKRLLSVLKTPKKKVLLTKPGAIFEDNSGESSGDDNETLHLKANIGSPSDSSSESSGSVGKGDLSKDSTRNGLNNVEGRSAGQKSISKLDISASKEMTMDMILKSSKRFKKAKLNASDKGYDSEQQLNA